jgi:hypothetical protein
MVKIQFTTPEGEVLTRKYSEGDIRIKKWLDKGWKKINAKKETKKETKKAKKK